ncbi:MAG: ribonuclease HII [Ignavibacteria bacterium]|jgi:ribonuclease HII
MLICGIDEAGRGPLAGPVVAAAVVMEDCTEITGARDSKTLSESVRNELSLRIKDRCKDYSIGIADHKEIDSLNILQATMLAMFRALIGLKVLPDSVLIDGNYFRLPGRAEISYNFKTIVKGDSKIHEISCASILAKVERDKIMKDYNEQYPLYGFSTNKGYPTPYHISTIRTSGICDIHRMSFCGKFISEVNCNR